MLKKAVTVHPVSARHRQMDGQDIFREHCAQKRQRAEGQERVHRAGTAGLDKAHVASWHREDIAWYLQLNYNPKEFYPLITLDRDGGAKM